MLVKARILSSQFLFVNFPKVEPTGKKMSTWIKISAEFHPAASKEEQEEQKKERD